MHDLAHDLFVESLVVVAVQDVQVGVCSDDHLVDHHEVLALHVLRHPWEAPGDGHLLVGGMLLRCGLLVVVERELSVEFLELLPSRHCGIN